VTTSSAHGFTGYEWVSVQGATDDPVYNNGYRVLAIPSTTTFLINQNVPNLASNGANGNVLSIAYPYKVRIEQLVWQDATAAQLTITDTNGNLVWSYLPNAVGGVYVYGKLFWVDGLVINALPAGTLQATIN
jgi:hypothetical protein